MRSSVLVNSSKKQFLVRLELTVWPRRFRSRLCHTTSVGDQKWYLYSYRWSFLRIKAKGLIRVPDIARGKFKIKIYNFYETFDVPVRYLLKDAVSRHLYRFFFNLLIVLIKKPRSIVSECLQRYSKVLSTSRCK